MRLVIKKLKAILSPLRIIIIFGVFIFLILLVLGDQGVLHLNKLLYMKKDLTAQQHSLQLSIEKLSKTKNQLNDPKILEFVIRKELGFIKPGEIIYQKKRKTEVNTAQQQPEPEQISPQDKAK
ncbi:MAG: hypothetical protein COS89_04140 [Deltaproteobacteria bacterium CG07_land_8_20_14_0_80_38_7]|nr:MAG: hypothetical protein COS89_04140 [Deltaproteobacteria bacterium CG07_land_8_20_14_0_80_38_7]